MASAAYKLCALCQHIMDTHPTKIADCTGTLVYGKLGHNRIEPGTGAGVKCWMGTSPEWQGALDESSYKPASHETWYCMECMMCDECWENNYGCQTEFVKDE